MIYIDSWKLSKEARRKEARRKEFRRKEVKGKKELPFQTFKNGFC